MGGTDGFLALGYTYKFTRTSFTPEKRSFRGEKERGEQAVMQGWVSPLVSHLDAEGSQLENPQPAAGSSVRLDSCTGRRL